VHVVVVHGVADDVAQLRRHLRPVEPGGHPVGDLGDVTEGFLARGQPQRPSRVVRDGTGIPDRIGVADDWRLGEIAAQHEAFLKPRHVADLPEQRINDRQLGADQLLLVEIRHQVGQPSRRVPYPPGQLVNGDFLGDLVRDAHRELLPVDRLLRNLGTRYRP
jgi:hypothetical protein